MVKRATMEAGRRLGRKTGCAAIPFLAGFVGESLEREIGNRTREFYQFMLPPIDVRVQDDSIQITVDVPGFQKDQISLRLDGNIMSISAHREPSESENRMLYAQRPNVIEKRVRLPAHIKRGEEPECPASLQDGVLVVTVPVSGGGKDIAIG